MPVGDAYFETRTEQDDAVAVKCVIFTSTSADFKEADTLETVLLDAIQRIKVLENDN